MLRKLRKLRRLSVRDWKLLICATFWLPSVGLQLKLKGFNRTRELLDHRSQPASRKTEVEDPQFLSQRIAQMVKIAAKYGVYRGNCLPQSLVAWFFTQRLGIRTDLCVGVRKDSPEFEAHAWVEYDGVAINDSQDVRERFAIFESKTSSHSSVSELK